MKFALVFMVCGISLIVLGVQSGGAGWLLVWPGASFVAIGAAYARLGPRIFGKRPDGTIAWWALVSLLPYLVIAWGVWRLQRLLTAEECCHQVAPGIWLGRRAAARELPAQVSLVVDLTAEFPEPRAVVAGRSYRCLTTLDASVPDYPTFERLVQEIAGWPGPVYIHCAMGHGRSAAVAAAVLIARGLAETVDQAEALLRSARPGVKLNRAQRAMVAQAAGLSAAAPPVV